MADGGTVERQDLVRNGQGLDGRDGLAPQQQAWATWKLQAPAFPGVPGFPRCSRCPWIFPGLSVTVELLKRFRYSQVALN